MNILVLTYCENVDGLQERLAYFASQNIEGLSDRITFDVETQRYNFNMFKSVRYSEDGAKSVGILEVFPQYWNGTFDENGNMVTHGLFEIINQPSTVIEPLADCVKYISPTQVNDVYANLSFSDISKIRQVVPEFITVTVEDENGDISDEIIEQSYRFAGLA